MRGGGTIAVGLLVAAALAARTGAPAQAGPRCTAVARVSGTPVLVGPVVALLRERGVPVAGESSCGIVSAVVSSEDERVRVTIIDGDGRVVERVVDDAEGAATAVESWARGDILDPLLAARAAPPRPAVDRETPRAIEIEEASRPAARRVDVAVMADAALSDDGALWAGVRGQGCVEIGATCVGAMLRYAIDSENGGLAEDLVSNRSAIDLLLYGELPLRFARDRFALVPGLGAGVSVLRADRDGICDTCEDEAMAVVWRGQLAATARLSPSLDARIDLGFTHAPFADTYVGEEDMDIDDELPLAGAPDWVAAIGLGLVYGGL